jgi:predicted house-cleaning noncanonical NTP pyrophosphatase (MazG superfamily)
MDTAPQIEPYVVIFGDKYKLVRDGIPDIMRADNATPHLLQFDPGTDRYRTALDAKFIEELGEFRKAVTRCDRANELADLLELISTEAGMLGFTLDQIIMVMLGKRSSRGAFHVGHLLKVNDDLTPAK